MDTDARTAADGGGAVAERSRTTTVRLATVAFVNEQVDALEATVAQLRLDLADLDGRLQNRGVVLANRIGAVEAKVADVEAQVETLSDSLVRHQDNDRRHGG